MQETQAGSLSSEDPLEKEMATYSSILPWRIPRIEEPGRLQSMGSQETDMTEWLNHHQHLVKGINWQWQNSWHGPEDNEKLGEKKRSSIRRNKVIGQLQQPPLCFLNTKLLKHWEEFCLKQGLGKQGFIFTQRGLAGWILVLGRGNNGRGLG